MRRRLRADVTSAFGVSWGVGWVVGWGVGCNVGWGVGCCGLNKGIGCGEAVAAAVGVGGGVAVGVGWVAAVKFAFEPMPNNVCWFVGCGVNWGVGCVVGWAIGSGAAVTDAGGSVLRVFLRFCWGIDCGAAVTAAIDVVGREDVAAGVR